MIKRLLLIILSSANLVAAVSITKTNYHGWADSYVIGNGKVEAVVVPAIGRVMQFRFAGESDGPFWENRALDGKAADPNAKDWINFGGDKTWPAPQADWPKVTPRGWPPPVACDSMPVEAVVEGEKIRLKSPVDPHYGIRTERVISLDDYRRMEIVTSYFKETGPPVKVAVWIITQLNDPKLAAAETTMGDKFDRQSKELPANLRVSAMAITLTRDPKTATKIGTDSAHLIWLGNSSGLIIKSERIPSAEYPDNGSSSEIYTNPDPLKYVELEALGALKTLKQGDSVSQTNVYTLLDRKSADLLRTRLER